jgi:PAS domain S-box-containing protein
MAEKTQRTVLIIDDNPGDRALYRRFLNEDPIFVYTTLEADTGEQGLQLCGTTQPDCILLDFRLPDMDGVEFLGELGELTGQVSCPIVMLTGQGNEQTAVQALQSGAQDYLVKDDTFPVHLHRVIDNAIEKFRMRRILAEQQRTLYEQNLALRQREEQIQLALAAAKAGTWEWNFRTQRVLWGGYIEQLFGLEPGSLGDTAKDFLGCLHPEDRDAVQQEIDRAKWTETEYKQELRVVWPDGSVHWIAAQGRFFRDAEGQPLRLTGVCIDITERKRAEEVLQSLNEWLEQRVMERTALVTLLQEISVAANEASSIEDVLQFAVDRICSHTGWSIGHAYLPAPDGTDAWVSTGVWHLETRSAIRRFIRRRSAYASLRALGWSGG